MTIMWGQLCQGCSIFTRRLKSSHPVSFVFTRNYQGRDLKRFYKNVAISQGEGGFEVNLDQKKLRTPLGTLFKVPSEALALAVAQEWNAQEKVFTRHSMHMTNLCNAAIDNPTQRDSSVVINGILEFLDTDTICYRVEEPTELAELQTREWDPVLEWVLDRYGVKVEATTGLGVPHIPEQTKEVFRQHMLSHNAWALVGYQSAAEALKSLVLTTALVDRHLSVEQAVLLSRLELEFQTKRWGSVEWHHDLDLLELRSRVAAAILFVHLNREESSVIHKLSQTRPS